MRFPFDGGRKLRPLLNCLVNQRTLLTMFGYESWLTGTLPRVGSFFTSKNAKNAFVTDCPVSHQLAPLRRCLIAH